MEKITICAFLVKFWKMSIFNDTLLLILVKFNIGSEFRDKNEFIWAKKRFLGIYRNFSTNMVKIFIVFKFFAVWFHKNRSEIRI